MGYRLGATVLFFCLLVASFPVRASNPPPLNPCSLLVILNDAYLRVHVPKENAFWKMKMNHSDYPEGEFEKRDEDYQAYIGDASPLRAIRKALANPGISPEVATGLRGWERFFEVNSVESAEAKAILTRLVAVEVGIAKALREAKIGYRDPDTGELVRTTQTMLGHKLSTSADERVRKAAWEGLREIENTALANGFVEALQLRNRFARALGYKNFYEYKLKTTEGIEIPELFAVLEDLETRTREPNERAAKQLATEKGEDALKPWNIGYAISGDLRKKRDPYLRIDNSVELWGRSFAALGISYRGATLRLDLIDRPGKYQNGFMHGPVPAFVDQGLFRPAEVNFTANAIPGAVGSGSVALMTLFHEGGHAAHFGNIVMPSPAFSQEYAPTSIALAETQSMFLDRLTGDPQWLTRYAKDREGRSIPEELLIEGVRQGHAFKAYGIRSMLAVPFAERDLYSLSDEEMTPERILSILRKTEKQLFPTGESPRPLLSVPHLLSNETSGYYHAYVMAELAVYQTYRHFRKKYGYVLDNPKVGRDLARVYWQPGNSRTFFELVRELTGEAFSAEAAIESVSTTTEQAVERLRRAIADEPSIPRFAGPVDLGATISIVHGDDLIASNASGASFEDVARRFSEWIQALEVQRSQQNP